MDRVLTLSVTKPKPNPKINIGEATRKKYLKLSCKKNRDKKDFVTLQFISILNLSLSDHLVHSVFHCRPSQFEVNYPDSKEYPSQDG